MINGFATDPISVRLPREVRDGVGFLAAMHHTTKAHVIRELLRSGLGLTEARDKLAEALASPVQAHSADVAPSRGPPQATLNGNGEHG
jgi:hypothetical protein